MYKYSPIEVAYQKQFGSDEALQEYLSNCEPFRLYGYSHAAPKKSRKCHLSKEKCAALDAALAQIDRDFRKKGAK